MDFARKAAFLFWGSTMIRRGPARAPRIKPNTVNVVKTRQRLTRPKGRETLGAAALFHVHSPRIAAANPPRRRKSVAVPNAIRAVNIHVRSIPMAERIGARRRPNHNRRSATEKRRSRTQRARPAFPKAT